MLKIMQLPLHIGVDHFGNVIKSDILNVAVATEIVVKCAHYISEMSQNCECFHRKGPSLFDSAIP
jgi:hypothetical protein